MRFVATLIAAFVAWLSLYFAGISPYLGTANYNRQSFGAGGLTIVGESRKGFDIGLEDFLFFEGQEVFVEYDADIRAGSLWFHVWRIWYPDESQRSTWRYMSESGKGTWTTPIERTGLYHISIEPTVGRKGGGWDIRYSVHWGARWQGQKSGTGTYLNN